MSQGSSSEVEALGGGGGRTAHQEKTLRESMRARTKRLKVAQTRVRKRKSSALRKYDVK
jgi:hypothetical protein